MSQDLTGMPDNRGFRVMAMPGEPYYYIRAKLDLQGQGADDNVLYLNKQNSLAYLNASVTAYPNPDRFPNFHMIDDHSLIGEVVVSSNPDLAYHGDANIAASGGEILSLSRSGNTATLVLNNPASSFGLQSGDFVTVSSLLNNGGAFNSADPVQITVSGNNISYPNAGNNYGGTVASGAQILSVARSSGTATITLSAAASSFGLVSGDYATISGILNNAGNFNAGSSTPVQIAVSGSTISYTNAGSDYGGVAASGAALVTIERNTGVATLTLNAAASTFGLVTGDYVTISGITNNAGSFDSAVPVQITVSGSTISYASGSGTLAPAAVTGTGQVILGVATGSRAIALGRAAGQGRAVQSELYLQVGGAYKPSSQSSSMDVWGGLSGNVPGPILFDHLEHAQVCYYGSEPADLSYDPVLGKRKFLAVKIRGGVGGGTLSGQLYVTLKVYPKFH